MLWPGVTTCSAACFIFLGGVHSVQHISASSAVGSVPHLWAGLAGNIMDGIPTLVIAVLIILLGLYLVKGPSRHEDASGDDYTAFKGDGSNG